MNSATRNNKNSSCLLPPAPCYRARRAATCSTHRGVALGTGSAKEQVRYIHTHTHTHTTTEQRNHHHQGQSSIVANADAATPPREKQLLSAKVCIEDLKPVFVAYSAYGDSGNHDQIDLPRFLFMCRSCDLLDKLFRIRDAEAIFNSVYYNQMNRMMRSGRSASSSSSFFASRGDASPRPMRCWADCLVCVSGACAYYAPLRLT